MIQLFVAALLIAVWSPRSMGSPGASSCLLVMERELHPISQDVKRKLTSRLTETRIILEAQPEDLLECAQSESIKKIILVVHALTQDGASEQVNLGYFKRLTGAPAQVYRKQLLETAPKRLQELNLQLMGTAPNWIALNSELKALSYFYTQASRDPQFPLYDAPKTFHDRFFEVLFRTLKLRRVPLEKLAIQTCRTKDVYERYESLKRLHTESVTRLEFAPESRLGYFLAGKPVTVLDPIWIERQILSP